jgi:hypothetical protein
MYLFPGRRVEQGLQRRRHLPFPHGITHGEE